MTLLRKIILVFSICLIALLYETMAHHFCISSFSYKYDERLKNVLNGMIERQIKLDKQLRIKFLEEKNYKLNQINTVLQSLEKEYEKERKKIFKYCKPKVISFFDYHSGFKYQYDHCTLEHHWTHQNNDWIEVEYQFDEESKNLFNQISEIVDANNSIYAESVKMQDVKLYKLSVEGLKCTEMYIEECRTYFGGTECGSKTIAFPITEGIASFGKNNYTTRRQ